MCTILVIDSFLNKNMLIGKLKNCRNVVLEEIHQERKAT